MQGNTESIDRLLLLWLELHQAMGIARSVRETDLCGEVPWESNDAAVRDIWRKLTDPKNCLALERWLCQSAEGQPAEWARRALQVSRERAGKGTFTR